MTSDELEFVPQGMFPLEVFVSVGEKQTQWQKTEQRLRGVKDALGKPIDEGIFDTVVALNVLGIHTVQSCEGHSDWGVGAPWIDIQAPDADRLNQEYKQIVEKRESEQNSRERLSQFLHRSEEESIRGQLLRQNLKERNKVMQHLSEFYRDRTVPFDQMLTLQSRGFGSTRIQSQGADFQEIALPEMKQQKLVEYQREIREFSAFLKQKFFAS